MGRFKRIGYKLLAVVALFGGSSVFAPSATLIEGQQRLLVGFLYGVLASSIHDLIGRDIVRELVGMTENTLTNVLALATVVVVYGGLIVALLWSLGELVVAFTPGLEDVAREELRSLDVLVTAMTVVVIEVINTEDQTG